mgnify:CR=1 FL=1
MSLTIGVDVGGTKVLGGVVDESGKILEKARRDTPREGGGALTKTIADVALELMRNHKVSAVGVSAAGFVSSDRKTMLATPNIAGWNGVNLDAELTELIGVDVVIENDGNAAAWGEAIFGAGRGEAHMLMLTVGTGIGSGIVVNGQLHRGAYGIAGEIGHMRVVPEGHLCGCGARGCFEQYASGSGLMRHVREAISQITPVNSGDIKSRDQISTPSQAWDDTHAKISAINPSNRGVITMDSGVRWERLAATAETNVNFMEIIYQPGSESTPSGDLITHEGYEYGYALEGEIEVTIGDAVIALGKNHSIGFDSSIPHKLRNTGKSVFRGIWFVHGCGEKIEH